LDGVVAPRISGDEWLDGGPGSAIRGGEWSDRVGAARLGVRASTNGVSITSNDAPATPVDALAPKIRGTA
jgi:hypothetical protein